MQRSREVILNQWGYYEIADKPTEAELAEFYAQRYYQQGAGQYQRRYSEAEQQWITHRLESKYQLAMSHLAMVAPPRRFLDIGAGEGWAMAVLARHGWQVTGIDYSRHGCASHNPAFLDRLRVGDIQQLMAELAVEGEQFELILLDNVLEHLREPLVLLAGLRRLLAAGGVLIIEVPNDFSQLQRELLASGVIDDPFWVVVPDHLHYFNLSGLTALAAAAGWQRIDAIADSPIDFNLFNPATNYVRDRILGKGCHQARVAIDNLIYQHPADRVLNYFRALAELGMGRQITLILQGGDA
jgi:2-polyprenyl-3-methyl-5-hydroxy-6-metoxy-1,4-benzoquinol methylase